MNESTELFRTLFLAPQRLPWLMYALLLLTAIAFVYWYVDYLLFAGWISAERATSTRIERGKKLPTLVLRLIALLLIGLACADPRFGAHRTEVRRSTEQIVILLDRSRSMLSEDASPSRIEVAKEAARRIVTAADGSSIALVSFAGNVRVHSPLTRNQAHLLSHLKRMEAGPDAAAGSQLMAGLAVALERFADRFIGPKRLVVITDGETHSPELLRDFELPAELDALVLCIGDDVRGGRIPLSESAGSGAGSNDREYLTHDGEVVWSKSNPDLLARLADQLNGRFAKISTPQDAVAAMKRGDRRERTETLARWRRTAAPLYPFLLFAALGCILCEAYAKRLWSWQKARRGLSYALSGRVAKLLAIVIVSWIGLGWTDTPAVSQTGPDELLGRRHAAKRYNRGIAAYRAGEFAEAASLFKDVIGSRNEDLIARAAFNLGNAKYRHVRGGGMSKQEAIARLGEALESYRFCTQTGFRINDARANIQLTYRLIQQIERQSPSEEAKPDRNATDETGEGDDSESGNGGPGSQDGGDASSQTRSPRTQPPADGQGRGGANASASAGEQGSEDASVGSPSAPPMTAARAEEELDRIERTARRRGSNPESAIVPLLPPTLPW